MIDKYLTDNELVIKNYEDAIEIQKRLLDNGYVVMLSREENFWVLNWIWDSFHDAASRRAAIFISREDYEWSLYNERVEKEKENEPELN